MKLTLSLVLICAFLCQYLPICKATVDDSYYYGKGKLPKSFKKGQHYPDRDEYLECRPIKLHIAKGTKRFYDLVTYTGKNVHFADANSRIMSSRLHSSFSLLADKYYKTYKTKLFVLKAWVPYPDYSLDNNSLHYEGRTIKIHVTKKNVTRLLKLAVQYADFDWVIYEKQGFARLSVIPDACEANLDIVFVLDQSGSVGWYNNYIALNFLENVVNFFTIGANETQVGLITYSTYAHVQFDLDDFHSKKAIIDKISTIGYPAGWTATALGLFQAGVILNPTEKRGARPISDGIPRIVVLITDGKSNRYPIDKVATSLHDFGIQVYTLGIGNIYLPELKFIASDPDPYHVFLLDSFNDAEGFVDLLSITTCETPAIVEPGENTTTEVPEDGFRFFQTECTAFSVSVIVEQIDIHGRCNLYASTVKPNPGPLDNRSIVVRNEDIKSNKRIVILKNVKKYIYISVRGIKTKNLFSVIIWDRLFQEELYTIDAPEGITNQSIFDFNRELAVTTESFFYRIKEGNDNNDFAIDNTAGVLVIRNALSIARQKHYELMIVAENQNASCHRGKVTIKITVVPNQLEFEDLNPISVPENTTGGTNVTQATAAGAVGLISYSIISGNTNNAFTINSETGFISVSTPSVLDFETLSLYQLTLQATALQGAATATATQVINIVDVNEPPVFTNSCAISNNCQFSVFENFTVSGIIGSIVATDPDLPSLQNGMLSYSIITSNVPFLINNNGVITLSTQLDREMVDSYQFVVMVSDGGTPSLSIQTDVTVTVLDSNDNAPVFASPDLSISTPESTSIGTIFAQYLASDRDIGRNAIITYSFVSNIPNIPFQINPNSGLVSVNDTLDADEGIQVYNVSVVASNFDGLSTTINISITVLDVNDNSPQFLQSPIDGTVVEGATIGTSVVQVNATDIDSGANGQVGYRIIGGNVFNSFAVNNSTGLITVNNSIDRETVAVFNLTVEAFDFGSMPRINTTQVIITVIDINDNAPIFMPDVLSLSLPEDQPLGSLDIFVVATDQDEPNSPNSQIEYSIIGGNQQNHFSINTNTGLLSLVSSLDFESGSDAFELTVRGHDLGNPSMSGTATVHVAVTNVNDHPPVISGDVEISVREDIPVGTELAQFTATDIDQMMIHFCFANKSDLFSINSKNGTVTLIAPLDFESATQHKLIIKASDFIHIVNATLTINVTDVNEFSPEFVGPVMFSVDEEQPINTIVGTVEATDGDRDSIVTYFFETSTISGLFNLNSSTGVITTAAVLDRETLVEENYFLPPDSKEQLVVVAFDNGRLPGPHRTAQNITITLNDTNDNPPIFNPSSYEASIRENTNQVTPLFTVSATDNDLGINAVIRYSIDDTNFFTIDPTVGTVSAVLPFNHEQRDVFNIIITATDLGNPPRSSTAAAVVRVIDVNDNAPRFTQDEYVIEVSESLSASSRPIIAQIATTDDDEGTNAGVTYRIEGSENCTPLPSPVPSYCFFSIGSSNGFIRLIRPLDFESQPQHNITVIATDTGTPMLSTPQLVTIDVINVDESPPMFNGSCNAAVPENVPVNSIITTCPAVDFDEVTDQFTNSISYSIVQGNEDQTFAINNSGVITNIVPLDRETRSQYTLRIVISDNNLLQNSMNVTILVLDVNDNSPQFVNDPYSTVFLESEIENYRSNVLNVSATDRDSGLNGVIVYEISDPIIDSDNNITILTVTATDRGFPSSLSTHTNVSIAFETSCSTQQYSIEPSTGYITVILLCRVTISPLSVVAALGQSFVLSCNVLRNIDINVQFLQNSSFVGSMETLLIGSNQVMLTRENVTFLDGGFYECRASSSVIIGLQTDAPSTVEIQVPPRIISGPGDIAVSSGQPLVTFSCMAEGVPTPRFTWSFAGQSLEASGRVSPNGGQLIITGVTEDDDGTYTCIASNEAGTDSRSGTLTVFGLFSVIIVEVARISAPDPVMLCNSFDTKQFQDTMNAITNQQASVTGINSTSTCSSDPCHPNPCVNGTCNVTDDGSFKCTCVPGFIGDTCNEDLNECNNYACFNGGTCENIYGGFVCHCPSGYYGDLCDYNQEKCLCPPGTSCLQLEGGSQCVADTNGNLLLIEKPVVSNIVSLDNTVNTLLEDPPSSSQSRRKRNGFVTVCSGRFVNLVNSSDMYSLVWVCPDDSEPPTVDVLHSICVTLIELQLVKVCHPPNGSPISIPDVPPSQAEISIILSDSSGQIMSGESALQLLQDSDALKKLNDMGYNALRFRQATPSPQAVSSTSDLGKPIGGVLAALLLIVLVSAIISLIVGMRCRKSKRQLVPTIELNEKGNVITNASSVEENIYSINTEFTSEEPVEHKSVNPYSLFYDPTYTTVNKATPTASSTKQSTFERAKKRHLEKSSSLEKLLDDDEGSKPETAEPIYANMNYDWHGNVGKQWENYWKTETLMK